VPGTTLPRQDPLQGIGNQAVDQITASSRQAVSDINVQIQQAYTDLQKTRDAYSTLSDTDRIGPRGTQLSQQIDAQNNQLAVLERNQSDASGRLSADMTTALGTVTLDPAHASALQAQADNYKSSAAEADARAKVLLDGADSQRQEVAARAGLDAAQALQARAEADYRNATSDSARQQALQQAGLYAAQTKQINDLLPGLVAQQAADLTKTQHQTGLTDAQSTYYQASADAEKARGVMETAQGQLYGQQATQLVPAQAQLATAQAGTELTKQQQALYGPLYGAAQQLQAMKDIHNQFFGPGSGMTPEQATAGANQAMSDWFKATVAGTTPYAASVAAANYQQNQYGQQMAGANALQNAMASRANAYSTLAGGALGTLEQMNAYAPKGSTGMAGAFQSILDTMANRLAQPQFAPTQIPTPPPMPTFLQGFAAGHQAGTTQANAQGGGQSPTINVNVNGQPAGSTSGPTFNPQASTTAINAAGFMDTPQGRAAMAGLGAGPPSAPAAGPTPAPAPSGYQTPPAINTPPATTANMNPGMTPQQAFAQGFAQNQPTYPNVLSMYGMNLPSPMQMLGGQPYVGMGA
jgi:hypothetical protein